MDLVNGDVSGVSDDVIYDVCDCVVGGVICVGYIGIVYARDITQLLAKYQAADESQSWTMRMIRLRFWWMRRLRLTKWRLRWFWWMRSRGLDNIYIMTIDMDTNFPNKTGMY